MERAIWQSLFTKRFILEKDSVFSQAGESTYTIKDKQLMIAIKAPTQTGALRADSITDAVECLVINRGQGRYSFVPWDQIDAITTVDN